MRRFLPLLRRRAQTATHKRELGRSAKPFASGNENPCHRRRRHYLCRLLINVSSRLLHVPNHPEITRCAEMKHWSYKPVYYHGQDVLPRQAYRERRGCWGQTRHPQAFVWRSPVSSSSIGPPRSDSVNLRAFFALGSSAEPDRPREPLWLDKLVLCFSYQTALPRSITIVL